MKKILILILFLSQLAVSFCQNVGIGTTTPGYSLDIQDSSYIGPVVRLKNNSSPRYVNGVVLSRQDSDKWFAGMRLSSNNYSITSDLYSAVFEIDSAGQVGIGTAAPASTAK